MIFKNAIVPEDKVNLKNPKWYIQILQVIAYVVIYEILAYLIGFLMSVVLFLLDKLPKLITAFWPHWDEFFSYTFTPLLLGFAVSELCSIIFKKYYFGKISTILCFMVTSYTVVSQLISVIAENGLINWAVGQQIWFDIILCGLLFSFLYNRSAFSVNFEKVKDVEIDDKETQKI